MNDFVYHIPTKMYFGKECLNKLAAEMKSSGKKVLIVYGGGSVVRSGLLDRLKGYLKDDFEVYEHSGIEPNPKIGSIRRAADTCKEKGIDMILAVGGGSVIDASKAIAAGACVDFDPWDFFGGSRKPIEKALPLYTVVTMASTGSEMTCGAVISNDENVDALGSCIGPQRSRISKVCEELKGEKIDVVKYSDDPKEFIAQALKPAAVISVDIPNEEIRECSVVVPDNQLSLAIGNKGQNAKLAARLTNFKIDIKPESGFFEGKSETEQ